MVQRFSHKTASNYSVFLVDPASRALYVGAKDAIFALPLDGISHRSRMVPWTVLQNPRNSCKMKGKKEAECHNFVRILEFANRTHLFVCGTFAFDPQCGFIKASDFRSVESPESGRGKCPFEPLQPSTAVMADPEFVASAFVRESRDGDDDKVYFFFTETAREYDFYEKVKVARVARVCKGDLGGQKTLQKKWTTFLKTRLVCSDPETGTVFNLLRDMVALPSTNGTGTVFYGVFAAQRSEGTGSAVCAYSLESVRRAMDGHFKEFKRDCDKRGQDEVPHPRPGACVTSSMKQAGFGSSLALPDRVLTFVRDHPLMDQPAYPLENRPVFVKPDARYRRLAVHRARALSGQEHDVLYLGTEDGHLHKAVKTDHEASLVEDLMLFAEHRPVRNLLILTQREAEAVLPNGCPGCRPQAHGARGGLTLPSPQNWLYVASDGEVTQIGTSNCAQYGTCPDCLLARDPACAWSKELGACRDHHGHTGLIQDLTGAKVLLLCPPEKEEAPPRVEVCRGQTSGGSPAPPPLFLALSHWSALRQAPLLPADPSSVISGAGLPRTGSQGECRRPRDLPRHVEGAAWRREGGALKRHPLTSLRTSPSPGKPLGASGQ
ncbi:PREDICTED: semaphorin-4F-like [Gekko japonicus]|uniref:Semaphorin-4F-like n=1 Tax=Gekko japonicus TaxID=146911 RepID=A0ABM1LAC8_GEKJA|nr:PREDICTED: semaphorin-4F-like [Gekko japonicus]